MGALGFVALGLLLAAAGSAPAGHMARWSRPIAEASARFGVPQDWIRRVIKAESGGRTSLDGRPIESPAGALGLMQLMPDTWRELRQAHDLGSDPHDPRDNILAGTAYLRSMYDRFGYPGLFAAYHAGPGRYSEHLATGRRLPAETIAYVAAVTGEAPGAESPPRVQSARIFFVTASAPVPDQGAGEGALRRADQRLFVPLSTSRAQ